MTGALRDHGGNLDAAIARYGGTAGDWLDLSTGINPDPYPVPDLPPAAWTRLPDSAAMARLLDAARVFWDVPPGAGIVAAPGASALIARLPGLVSGAACIPGPTYNEHAAAFGSRAAGGPDAPIQVYVHPNNPDGRTLPRLPVGPDLTIIDESFCDTIPAASHIAATASPGAAILKSFGKFWGLAGVRLGFLIAARPLTDRMQEALGPWPVSGAALHIGAMALEDLDWAAQTRIRLDLAARRLDTAVMATGATLVGGTALFRLYDLPDAAVLRDHLAHRHIWTRTFPYNTRWIRLGLPPSHAWDRLEAALSEMDGTAGGAKPQASAGPPSA